MQNWHKLCFCTFILPYSNTETVYVGAVSIRLDRLQCVLKSLQWVRIADAMIVISRLTDSDNADVDTRVSTLGWG